MSSDEDFLTRLNALKKSSVSLDRAYNSRVAVSPSLSRPEDLATRFARLGSISPLISTISSGVASANAVRAPTVAPDAPSYLHGIAGGIHGHNVEFNEEDEKTLEDLLGHLKEAVGPEAEWALTGQEERAMNRLLEDAKNVLSNHVDGSLQGSTLNVEKNLHGDRRGQPNWETIEYDVGTMSVPIGKENDGYRDCDRSGADKELSEDKEVEDVVAPVMAELELSRSCDSPSSVPEDCKYSTTAKQLSGSQDHNDLNLPTAPTELLEDDSNQSQKIEDALKARLAALASPSSMPIDSLGLPSAPSFSPRKQPLVVSSFEKQVYDEIETWCVLCQDDATLRCLGCDGDLYCQICWTEGHRGESAGIEEKRHQTLEYVRKKKELIK
ncbi:hypothetical protein ACEQ8H_008827 [Pleosporales sp. CAS-2024a]